MEWGRRDLRRSIRRRVFVLTHRPSDKREDPRISFVSDGIEEAVATAQTAAGDRDVGIFGASLSQQCLQAGLLVEIVIHLAPVLLGGGVELFSGGDGSASTWSGSPWARGNS